VLCVVLFMLCIPNTVLKKYTDFVPERASSWLSETNNPSLQGNNQHYRFLNRISHTDCIGT
jgi:hypothetical protein